MVKLFWHILEHINRTSLNMVGMQVWRSALLIGDFIIENRQDIFTHDKVVLELGSGVGLTGIVAAMYCKEVVLTGDIRIHVLLFILLLHNTKIVKEIHFT